MCRVIRWRYHRASRRGPMTDAIEPRDTPDDRARLDSSLTLFERARAGDRRAVEVLIARYLPRMRRWATGRLPPWARDMADTHDLVQETLFQTFRRIDR